MWGGLYFDRQSVTRLFNVLLYMCECECLCVCATKNACLQLHILSHTHMQAYVYIETPPTVQLAYDAFLPDQRLTLTTQLFYFNRKLIKYK